MNKSPNENITEQANFIILKMYGQTQCAENMKLPRGAFSALFISDRSSPN